MVLAWRLYRAHIAERHRLLAEAENYASSQDRKEKDMEKQRRRTEEKKKDEISLLEFTRQVVDLHIQESL
jgi:hypothetical protein